VSAYVVYDKSTLAIVKSGIAAAEECASQVDDEGAQAVISADSAEELDALKVELGLH
jgi:hypothetical protein